MSVAGLHFESILESFGVAAMSSSDARIFGQQSASFSGVADGKIERISWLEWIRLKQKTDEELAAELDGGQHEALTVLFQRYSPMVYRNARRILRNEAEAEDIVQQIFIEYYHASRQFDASRGSFRSWLMMFAYCRVISRWRQLQTRHYYDSPSLEDILPSVLDHVQENLAMTGAETSYLIEQALSLVQPKQRVTIELTYYEGFTPEEIAERTGQSIAAVRHNLYRGLDKIRTILGETSRTSRKSNRSEQVES